MFSEIFMYLTQRTINHSHRFVSITRTRELVIIPDFYSYPSSIRSKMPSLMTLVFTVVATELILGAAAHNLRVGVVAGLVPAIRANAVRGNGRSSSIPGQPHPRVYHPRSPWDVSTDTLRFRALTRLIIKGGRTP